MVKLEQGELASGAQQDHRFTSNVLDATVQLSGFAITYPGQPDHHLESMRASVGIVAVDGPVVTVRAEDEIEDSSGFTGTGKIGYLLIAEVE